MIAAAPPLLSRPQITSEWLTCAASPLYFVNEYCQAFSPHGDGLGGTWVPFRLWPAQVPVLRALHAERRVIILKARQLGLSQLTLAYALWRMLFHPAATVGVFSRRQEESVYLLGPERLRGMYARLPSWMQARAVTSDNDTEWALSNGSVARAFPTSAGDSYVNSLVIADEFDLVEDQERLLGAVKPTVDAGGKLILVSRAAKTHPLSAFKRIYTAARAGQNDWHAVFLPWTARPDRTPAWYAAQQADVLSRTGALDALYEQYPATDAEALAPPSLNKRIPAAWLLPCYTEGVPIVAPGAPALPGLTIYAPPAYGTAYLIGADPAEGNPTSDDSSATVVDSPTGREVAHLAGKFEPTEFAGYLAQLAAYYALNRGRARPDGPAGVLVERNNHGHAVLAGLRAAGHVPLQGLDGRAGWLSSPAGKTRLYDIAAQSLKDGDAGIATWQTYLQLASIESATLRAPEGQHEDDADGWALAQAARTVQAVPLSSAAPAVRRALAGFRG